MSDDTPFESMPMTELVERSSFGTRQARRHRRRTPPAVTQQLLADLLEEMGTEPDRAVTATRPDPVAPYFYLSRARGTDSSPHKDDADVRRFFQLLCTYLTQLATDIASDESAPAPAMVPGYLAGDTAVTVNGQQRMLSALSTCRVFVPLITPDYLADRRCREEWATFRRRDDVRRPHHPFGFSAIVPVLWEPIVTAGRPEWSSDVALTDPTLGDEYVRRGLRAMLAEGSPAYQQVVFRIARHIHDVAECLPGTGG
jgi:hypothetical protein